MMAGSSRPQQELEPHTDSIEMKNAKQTVMSPEELEQDASSGSHAEIWNDSINDMGDMQRLGKQQEMKRNFNFLSALGFVSIYMATWEFVLVSLSVGFANGGFGGLFWCFLTTVTCYGTIVVSLAEMASMAPTSAGQYHFVSELAPPKYQRFLSYTSGWMSTLGWLASVASSTYVVTTQIEAMIEVYLPDFVFTPWQYTLIMWLFTALTIVFNTWGAGVLPALEIGSLFGHLAGFLIVLIPLLVLCPKNDASEVFLELQNTSGYSSMGTAFLLSQITVIYCNLGSDSVIHISEEVNDASMTVPRCMWWSYVGNVSLGVVMLITMLFCIGPLDDVLESDVPYLLLFNNTGSPALSLALNIILFLLIYSGNITALATCGREMWAFARDRGLPFSLWVGKMDQKWHIPFNSIYATSAFVALLCLIQLGSTLAFNIIVSISVLGLLSTYMLSIGCVLLRRIRGQPLPHARWSLGRYGLVINAFAFCYCGIIIVFCCFPVSLPVDVASANYAPLVWVATIVFSGGFYYAHGRKHYTAPVDFVEGRKAAGVGMQTS